MRDDAHATGDRRPRAVILGCAGEELSPEEAQFFRQSDPLGFVLFKRNCVKRDQLRELVTALRRSVGRADAPVLIDQEGGRVARLQPPEWRKYPSAQQIAGLPDELAPEAARLMGRLIADDLAAAGITIDAAPVLDVPVREADPIIGDRAWGADPPLVARLGRAFCNGLLAGGVLPIIKHIPGHGRARVDSHMALPRVEAGNAILAHSDFAPFRALSAMPWAMTAHIVYSAIDDTAPATFSRRVIETVIRGDIGFGGVLVSDDISMGALSGTLGERAARALEAGCDLALHCSGDLSEMAEVVAAVPPVTQAAQARLVRGEALRRRSREDIDRRGAGARFGELLAAAKITPSANR
ncbi:MAG: beta-N-acetylhexosaminidase [Alphaproteobacteria bacterium]|nr:beta-N-acetylhexosaminidase [Alphaproteobacteria bacterium]